MKNMINKNIKLIGCLFLIATGQSCTVDEQFFSVVTSDTYLKTDEEYISALGAAYTRLYKIGTNEHLYPLQEVTTDEMVVPTRGNDWGDGGKWVRLHQHTFTPEDPEVGNGWNFVYGGINDCNRLIYQFELAGAEGSEAFIAELKVLRALFYYWAMDLYGNVPIVDRFDVEPGFLPETKPRAEVYSFIETEILENMDLLSTDVDVTTYGRINYYVAQTMLAKLYLNAEVYTGEAQWEKASDACDAVINSGKFNLTSNYFENFSAANTGTPEIIFAVPYDRVFAKGLNLSLMHLHGQSKETFNLATTPWNGFCTMQEFYESYDEEDKRRLGFLVGPQHDSGGSPLLDPNYEKQDPENPDKPFDPNGAPIDFTVEITGLLNALKQDGARVAKWEYAAGGTTDMENDFAIYRYADVLLMKAEALWRLNPADANALVLVNTVRLRGENPVDPFVSLTAENLLAERGRELFSETHRRQDLIRFGEYNKSWWEKSTSDPDRNIFPIPRPQLEANPNLTQNPGYGS